MRISHREFLPPRLYTLFVCWQANTCQRTNANMSEPTTADYTEMAEQMHGGLALYMPRRHSAAPPPYGGSMFGRAMAMARKKRQELGPPQFGHSSPAAPSGSGMNSRAKALAMLDGM
eukprot:m.281945 g.281945  ORF g.281945 m.281945 type:complete len:117 (+) comp11108_c0_seq13:462-812(+)